MRYVPAELSDFETIKCSYSTGLAITLSSVVSVNSTLYWMVRRACMSVLKRNIGVSVSERLICAIFYGYAFGTLHVCPNNYNVPTSGVQQKGFDCTVIGWVWLNHRYCNIVE